LKIESIDKKYFKKLKATSKIALIADTHLSIERKDNNFLVHMDTMFAEFKKLCIEQKVDLIVIAGDLFHSKSIVNTHALVNVNNILQDLSAVCPIIIIPGNHDLPYADKPEINLASIYKHFDTITVIEYPSNFVLGDTEFLFVPYHNNITAMLNDIKKDLDFTKQINLFSHFGTTDFKVSETSNQYVDDEAAEVSALTLKKFNKVFLGHYHGYQTKKNITYVSAPLQSRHGDELSKHGFVIFDLASNTHKFFENKATPRFITYELNKTNAMEMLKLENHYIRINVKKHIAKEIIVGLRQQLMKKNPEVKIIFDFKDSLMKLPELKGWNEIIFNSSETLLTNFLTQLEAQGTLPFDKDSLIKHLEL